ncbi:conjugal transfer protein TraG N-terminal domain-containing protein [Alteromonas macleodii]|uniref:Membrane protein n=1 Tax=Alteromonas macleodii TaxID=28108 RepID=A0AB36FN22_ALTMA|nr:conjugal transfer protein TraG N-terminal domain-containing protein [Alteromonas macleodii]OES24226.1 putative membrane protein [Alteromonas macleodii]OES24857.1 putative membrane protein [Alteromonas macleodii]OES25135.1 putative membrane protein [Alteromonas macleodii]OES39177.1 putative membrane protein [Alteromonas macleodii]
MKKTLWAFVLSFFTVPALAVDLDFYVYGDFDSTVGAFTRAALIFADADWLGLFFIASVFGLFSGGITLFWNGLWRQTDARQLLQYIFYPIMGITLYVTLILQTGTMHIFDETQNKYRAVGGVPDGIVLVAGAFNKLERVVAEVASDNPATVRSSLASGTGIKMFLDAFASNPLRDEPDLQRSLNQLILDCTDISMMSNANLDLDYIRTSAPNARSVLQEIDTNAVRTTTYANDGTPTVRTCAQASANIIGRLDALAYEEATEELCAKAGYQIGTVGGPGAAAERAACQAQLESVSRIFLGAAFGGGAPELFTNIAVYNTIATNVNDANIVVNGLGSRQIASEGIATLAVTEDWLPQIRGGMLVTLLSIFVIVSLFIVTPLYGKAIKVILALFVFLAIWGAASSLQLMSAYDQVIYAARSINFHAGGLEAYLLAPTTAISALAIIGDSLSTAMMLAAAITTIFTGVSAYGLSNAMQHAAGKVEGIGSDQGKNLTSEGKADIIERQANSIATHQVAGAMGAADYGQAHVQTAIEKNMSSFGRYEGIQQQGGTSSQVSRTEGLKEGGSMVPLTNVADPSTYGAQGAEMDIGTRTAQIGRAQDAGGGNISHGSEQLEYVRNSSTSATLNAHGGDINEVDKTTLTDAMGAKGHAKGQRVAAESGGTTVEQVAERQGLNQAADNIASTRIYRTPEEVIATAQAKGAYSAGQVQQNIADAQELNPDLSTPAAMKELGKDVQALSNNQAFAADGMGRDQLIDGERFGMISRTADANVLNALAGKLFNEEGTPVTNDDLLKAAQSESPLRSMAVMGQDIIDIYEENGMGHLATNIQPEMYGELSAATTIDNDGNLALGNVTYEQGGKVVLSDTMEARSGMTVENVNRLRDREDVEGLDLLNVIANRDEQPAMFNMAMNMIDQMDRAELVALGESINDSQEIIFHGDLSTNDSSTWGVGAEAYAGVTSPIVTKAFGADYGVRASTDTRQDNVDSRETGGRVAMAGNIFADKIMEIRESNAPTDVATDPTRLNVGTSLEDELKDERTANFISTWQQTATREADDGIKYDDVNNVNGNFTGKTGEILRDLSREETDYYRSQGWETGSAETPEITPQMQAERERQQAELEALQKKVRLDTVY